MEWLYLVAAGMLEVVWAVGLKYLGGGSRAVALTCVALAMAGSLALLTLAYRAIPVGTAYAVWTGIGAAGTVVMGILLFGEPATFGRLACVGLILAGIIGLKLAS